MLCAIMRSETLYKLVYDQVACHKKLIPIYFKYREIRLGPAVLKEL